MNKDLGALRRSTPDILIATPGRLNDHLQNEGLADKMRALRVLVFDEADRLLDMGFRWVTLHANFTHAVNSIASWQCGQDVDGCIPAVSMTVCSSQQAVHRDGGHWGH